MTYENAADAESARDGLTPAKPKLPDYVREHLERKGEIAELMAGHGITIESRRIPHRSDHGREYGTRSNLNCPTWESRHD